MSNEDLQLLNEGVVLTATQLIPTSIKVNDDMKTRYSAFAYVSDSYLHLRLFDGTSEEYEPFLSFGAKKIWDATFYFRTYDQDDERKEYIFFDDRDNYIVFSDASTEDFETISKISSCPSLLFAAKLIFIDLIHYIITKNDAVMIE